MDSFNRKATFDRVFQVNESLSIQILLFLLTSSAEATDLNYESPEQKRYQRRTLIALLGYLVLTIVIFVCICLKIKLCGEREMHTSELDEPNMTNVVRKLDISLIDSFPLVTFPPLDNIFCFTECHICLEEFEQGEIILKLPACGHGYHKDCITRWMSARDSRCPNCRHEYGHV
ncbi:RING-H2 finger protein ATL80-like [Andrographis paniculata]|uniref:RING-H2 finger protein ATL80-like n=1 Tax=Andrographis paniculata TaxID=175694 RepID=UPI0021E7F7AB|nr:RING-H2 finger protein ATL80-like [Andrographis paniculata]